MLNALVEPEAAPALPMAMIDAVPLALPATSDRPAAPVPPMFLTGPPDPTFLAGVVSKHPGAAFIVNAEADVRMLMWNPAVLQTPSTDRPTPTPDAPPPPRPAPEPVSVQVGSPAPIELTSAQRAANVVWGLSLGWVTAVATLSLGAALCLTVIGIPLGLQCFKVASFAFMPFGRDVIERNDNRFDRGLVRIGNAVWLLTVGYWVSLLFALVGLACCATVVGVRFGVECFRVTEFALRPMGRSVPL